jgi:hypothetical protein
MFNGARLNSTRFGGIGSRSPWPTAGLNLITHDLSIAFSSTDGTHAAGGYTETGTNTVRIARQFYAGSTDVLIAAAWTIAATQALYLLSTTDLTVKTNSATSPADTIELKAGMPLVWEASGGYYPNPFSTDVTAFYCTCTAAAVLQGAILTV